MTVSLSTERAVTSFSPFDRDDLWDRPVATAPTFTNQPRRITPEPELTETSYDTVPETKPESETETIKIDTNMVGESLRLQDDPMGDEAKKDDPTVIKLNLPKDFSGKREDLKKFLQQVNLYMDVNTKIYHNDMTKIAFVLSFMDEGDTSSWKEQFLEEATSTSPHDYSTWTDFEKSKGGLPTIRRTRRRPQRDQNLVNGEQLHRGPQRKIPNALNQIQTRQDFPSCYQLLLRNPQPSIAKTTSWIRITPYHSTGVVTTRRKNQGRKSGRSPRKTPMRWMWTSCPLKKEMRLWRRDYVLDVENTDTSTETVQTRRGRLDPIHQLLPHQKKWMRRNFMPTSEA